MKLHRTFFRVILFFLWKRVGCTDINELILEKSVRFVLFLDLDHLFMYEATTSNHLDINDEAIQFLDWMRVGMPHHGYYPELIFWTANRTQRFAVNVLKKRLQDTRSHVIHEALRDKLPYVIDLPMIKKFGLHTNYVMDWGKLRRHLYRFGDLQKAHNTAIFFFIQASSRAYNYNVCYMQQHIFNSIPVVMQWFHPNSSSYKNPSRFYSYFVDKGRTWVPTHSQTVHVMTDEEREKGLRETGQRFHDVRRIFEMMANELSDSPTLTNLEHIFRFLPVPSLLQCPYAIHEKDRIYIVLILDLKPIQYPQLPSLDFLSGFLKIFLRMSRLFVGNIVQSVLLHCHPLPDEGVCKNMQNYVVRVLQNNSDVTFKTVTGYVWDSAIPFLDVICPKTFPDHENDGMPNSMIEAVEYGIASQLPRRTTILLKISDTFPDDVNDNRYASKAGENHICYSDLLKPVGWPPKHQSMAAKISKKKQMHSIQMCPNRIDDSFVDPYKCYDDRREKKKGASVMTRLDADSSRSVKVAHQTSIPTDPSISVDMDKQPSFDDQTQTKRLSSSDLNHELHEKDKNPRDGWLTNDLDRGFKIEVKRTFESTFDKESENTADVKFEKSVKNESENNVENKFEKTWGTESQNRSHSAFEENMDDEVKNKLEHGWVGDSGDTGDDVDDYAIQAANPLTQLDFLSQLTIALGLLKRIQMRGNLIPHVTPRTAYEAVKMFQRGMGNRFACYSFFEY